MNHRTLLIMTDSQYEASVDDEFDVMFRRDLGPMTNVAQSAARVNRALLNSAAFEVIRTIGLILPQQTYQRLFVVEIDDLQNVYRRARVSSSRLEIGWLSLCIGVRGLFLAVSCVCDSVRRLLRP